MLETSRHDSCLLFPQCRYTPLSTIGRNSLGVAKHPLEVLGRAGGRRHARGRLIADPDACSRSLLQDGLAAYAHLLEEHPDAEIYLGGDSAGGGLAASMLAALRGSSLPFPKALSRARALPSDPTSNRRRSLVQPVFLDRSHGPLRFGSGSNPTESNDPTDPQPQIGTPSDCTAGPSENILRPVVAAHWAAEAHVVAATHWIAARRSAEGTHVFATIVLQLGIDAIWLSGGRRSLALWIRWLRPMGPSTRKQDNMCARLVNRSAGGWGWELAGCARLRFECGVSPCQPCT